jgi:ApaG protein
MPAEEQISIAVTEGIRIVVRARYVPDQSVPAAGRYVFSYTVRIRNEGPQAAQLKSRHWLITDSVGRVQDVRGAGVVGEQPLLRAGKEFEYTSSAVIETARGVMRGSYEMSRPNGCSFNAEIAPFTLALPYSIN